jgi:3-dehydroquinate dehydratase-2
MKIKIVNGPNINMIGIREPAIYGSRTYKDLITFITQCANENNVDVDFFQSNSEGDIVTEIQSCYQTFDAIVINPAAYTHTSVAILDALKAVAIPAIEVHLSKVSEREAFRQLSYPGMYCEKTYAGYGFDGYKMAIEYLVKKYNK